MSNALLSVESNTLDFMTRRNCSTLFISGLAGLHGYSGLSQPRLSQALNGTRPLEHDKAQELKGLIDDLDGYCHSISPIPLDLRNPLIIKNLLDDFRTKKKEQEEQFVVYVWALKLDSNTYFKTLLNGQLVRTVSLPEAAAFENMQIANEAVKRLKALKIDTRADSFTNARRKQAEIISSTEQFAQVGL